MTPAVFQTGMKYFFLDFHNDDRIRNEIFDFGTPGNAAVGIKADCGEKERRDTA